MLGNPRHWVRQLPGGLLHNLISHGLARLAEFLSDEIDELIATAHVSPALENACGGEVLDELRVMMRDGKNTTAYFTFSTQIKPPLNRLRICGPLNSIEVDLMSGKRAPPDEPERQKLSHFPASAVARREGTTAQCMA